MVFTQALLVFVMSGPIVMWPQEKKKHTDRPKLPSNLCSSWEKGPNLDLVRYHVLLMIYRPTKLCDWMIISRFINFRLFHETTIYINWCYYITIQVHCFEKNQSRGHWCWNWGKILILCLVSKTNIIQCITHWRCIGRNIGEWSQEKYRG